ncbi:type IV secretory system conjugative DNA transfer family protein [uncultured Sneathiella sp.]|uniref:type IV secretory system conjugative DNA transfer family protein n=1 Tax=uncultured Sneathiella sp. TaxID=879315 RepID=UPI0030D6CEB1
MIDNEKYRFGSASWSQQDDLRRAGMFEKKGLQIGYYKNQPIYLETDAPIITIAGAGSGKLRDLLAMAVAQNAGGRNFILDPRGEISVVTMINFAIAKAFLNRWNPTGMHSQHGQRMNPLDILKFNSPTFHADCKFIAKSLIPTIGSGDGRYFELRAQEWLENIIKMLVEKDGVVTFPTFYRVINWIESDSSRWADYLEYMLNSSLDSVRRTAGEMLAKQQDAPREFGSIIGEIYAYLNFLDDPMLQASLENADASLADTCHSERPTSWAINVPIEYVSLWAPLLRTMFTVQMLYKSRAPGAPPINMIIDEAGQLGNFEALLKAFTFGRGAGVRTWALFQDAGQIIRNFGAPALQGFMGSAALRQFFGVRDYQTAQMISSMLGTETLEYDESLRQADARRQKRNAAMNILNGGDPFTSFADMQYHAYAEGHRTKQSRPLMTPEEILAMPENRQIQFISTGNLKPVFAEKDPYYQRREYIGRFLPNPYHPPLDSMPIPSRWRTGRAKVITEPVPAQLAQYPQYASGTWSYVEGYRPKI